MVNEVVKYHNDLNTIAMRNWSAEEMDFFFAILSKVRDEGTKPVEFTSEEVKELSRFANKHRERWEKTMESAADKITQINYIEKKDRKIRAMNLFSVFEVDLNEETVTVQVSPNFEYVLNHLDARFTRYELEEIVQLKSTYAKTGYRLLKQWRIKGKREFKIEEFRFLFDIPKSYKSGDIYRRAIKPILNELQPLFPKLNCKIVKRNTRGNPVTSYIFTWQPEQTSPYDPNKYEKKQRNKIVRKETLPDWFGKETTKKDEYIDPEVEKEFNEKLKKMREDKK